MAIVFRADIGPYTGKGSPLTKEEVDGNFYDLVTRTITLEDGGAFTCESVTYTGTSITFNWSDATTSGPFVLPVATFTPRGIWLNSTTYFYLDVVSAVGIGMYLVLIEHTTAALPATFDPTATIGGNPVYLIIGEVVDYTSIMFFRGDFAEGFLYGLDDVFLDEAQGLFRVSISHVSGSTFNPFATSGGFPLYRQLAGPAFPPVILIIDDTYTLLLADRGQYLRFQQGCVVTIPQLADMPIGSEIHFEQAGDEEVIFLPEDEMVVTIIEQRPGFSTSTPYRGSVVTAKYVAVDTWKLIGPHGAEISA
jgi:hypothetical protein